MAVVVPFEDHDIEVGTRYAPRYLLLQVHSWIAVDGELVAAETFASADDQVLSGRFPDPTGREREVRVELGRPDSWRGHLAFVLFVDDQEVAHGKTNLGKHEAAVFRATLATVLVLAMVALAVWLSTVL